MGSAEVNAFLSHLAGEFSTGECLHPDTQALAAELPVLYR